MSLTRCSWCHRTGRTIPAYWEPTLTLCPQCCKVADLTYHVSPWPTP